MFLKVVAILILIVFAFRMLARFFLPLLGKYAIKKVNENMQERAKTQQQGEKIYQDGEVEIRKTKSDHKTSTQSNDDEYIDYEELK
jgi:hypothetical protein